MLSSRTEWNGIPFAPMPLGDAVPLVLSASVDSRPVHFHLCNAWTTVVSSVDSRLRESLVDDDAMNLVDGVPLSRELARIAGRPADTTRGPSLFEEAVPALASANQKQLLFGSTEAGLARILDHFESRGVNRSSIGVYAPPFRDVDETMIAMAADAIQRERARIVWIGLGTPKQDILAKAIAARLGIPTVCVGAAFDFVSGDVMVAPTWIQGSGFEWAYRFAKEPRRLWRRYTWGNAKFLWMIIQNRMKQSRAT